MPVLSVEGKLLVLHARVPERYLQQGPEEKCCLMLGSMYRKLWVVESFLKVPNRADNPCEDFLILRSDVPSEALQWAVGVLHSHPMPGSPEPSDNDLTGLPEGWLGGVFYNGSVNWYTGNTKRPVPKSRPPTKPGTPKPASVVS
jgi:proteasome lid subunit RPN8/RPN11